MWVRLGRCCRVLNSLMRVGRKCSQLGKTVGRTVTRKRCEDVLAGRYEQKAWIRSASTTRSRVTIVSLPGNDRPAVIVP